MEEGDIYVFPAAHLKNFAAEVSMHFGITQADAWHAADVLSRSDLRGIDSHGVARLHTYFDMLELGRINPKPKIKIVREKTSVATVDGDNGLGFVVGPKANEIDVRKAERHGSGWVSVGNTNHLDIAGGRRE
jgi:LDH2 family malate/lactate/ureidoglycolate dehydrogenase